MGLAWFAMMEECIITRVPECSYENNDEAAVKFLTEMIAREMQTHNKPYICKPVLESNTNISLLCDNNTVHHWFALFAVKCNRKIPQ